MNGHSIEPISEKLQSILSGNKEIDAIMKSLQRIKRNYAAFFKQDKLVSLFIKAVDSVNFISFYKEDDRRIKDKRQPRYKLAIDWKNLPLELSSAMQRKGSLSDAKIFAVHNSVINCYIDLIIQAVDNHDEEVLNDKAPATKEEMQEVLNSISTLYVILTDNEPGSPIWVRPIV
jgi:hypothetical protein